MSEQKSRKGCSHACERCRKSKIRCSVETVDEHGKCRRCYQAGTKCVFPPSTVPQQRRRRTDARVASLEKQLNDLSAALVGSSATQRSSIVRSTPLQITDDDSTEESARRLSLESNRTSEANHISPSSGDDDIIPGYVPASLLPYEQAIQLFSHFQFVVVDEYPILILCDDDTFEELRRRKPLLLWAIITAACRGVSPLLFQQLHSRLQKALLEKVMLDGQKSLELLQAILLLEVWYCIPDDLSRLSFYQWINMAATMSIHLGLLGSSNTPSPLSETVMERHTPAIEQQLELWRTALAIGLSVSTVAISLHREAIFAISEKCQYFLHALDINSTAINDKRLVAWMNLQMMAEQVENIKTKLNNGLLPATSRNDIQGLEERFDLWKQSIAPEVLNNSLEMHYLYCRCKFYELSMVFSQSIGLGNLSDISITSTSPGSLDHLHDKVTPASVKAIMSMVNYCHRLITKLQDIETSIYLDLPTVTTIRVLYAVNTLSTLQKLSNKPRHVVSSIIDGDTIMLDKSISQVKAYLGKVLSHNEEHKVPSLVLSSLDRIADRPYLSPLSTPESQHFDDGSHITKHHGTPQNDFEAVVVSSMPQDDRSDAQDSVYPQQREIATANFNSLEQPSNLSRQQALGFPDIDHYTFGPAMNLDIQGSSDLELMRMPNFVSGSDSCFTDGHDVISNFLGNPDTNQIGVAYNTFPWS